MAVRRLFLGVLLLLLALNAVLANGGEEDCSAIEKEVREFYTKNNPKMLDKLDGVLFRYKGREEMLLSDLKEKYKDKPVVDAAAAAASEQPPPSPSYDHSPTPKKKRKVYTAEENEKFAMISELNFLNNKYNIQANQGDFPDFDTYPGGMRGYIDNIKAKYNHVDVKKKPMQSVAEDLTSPSSTEPAKPPPSGSSSSNSKGKGRRRSRRRPRHTN